MLNNIITESPPVTHPESKLLFIAPTVGADAHIGPYDRIVIG